MLPFSSRVAPNQKFSNSVPVRPLARYALSAGRRTGNAMKIATTKDKHKRVKNKLRFSCFTHNIPKKMRDGNTVNIEKQAMEKQV